MNFGKQIKKI